MFVYRSLLCAIVFPMPPYEIGFAEHRKIQLKRCIIYEDYITSVLCTFEKHLLQNAPYTGNRLNAYGFGYGLDFIIIFFSSLPSLVYLCTYQ